jgi:hypothetical protein
MNKQAVLNGFKKKQIGIMGLDAETAVLCDGTTGFTMQATGHAFLSIPEGEWHRNGRTVELAALLEAAKAKEGGESPATLDKLRRALHALAPLPQVAEKIGAAVRGASVHVSRGSVKLLNSSGTVLAADGLPGLPLERACSIQVVDIRKVTSSAEAREDTIMAGASEDCAVVAFKSADGMVFTVVPYADATKAVEPREEGAKPKPKAAKVEVKEEPKAVSAWEFPDVLLELEKVQAALNGLRTSIKTMAKERTGSDKDQRQLLELVKKLSAGVK